MERISTGIVGLDRLMEGGLPKGSFTILTGGPGTGKTIFAIQFLSKGAYLYGDKGMYISIEQPKEEIIAQARQFGWDLKKLEENGKVDIKHFKILDILEMTSRTVSLLESLEDKYDRLVIDSITSLVSFPLSPSHAYDAIERGLQPTSFYELIKLNMAKLIDSIKELNITTIATSQKIDGLPGNTPDGFSEFRADGLIVLDATAMGRSFIRTIQIKKMRLTKIEGIPHTFDFTKDGIVITD